MGVLTSAAKLAGGLKVAVTARFFGTSDALDAFLIAFLLPSFLSNVIAGSFTPALVPLLVRTHASDGPERANRVARSALGFALAIMIIAALGLALTGKWLLPLAGSSFDSGKLRLADALFFGLLFWLPMSACIATWRAVLNASGRFALAAIAPLATPVAIMAALFAFAARYGVAILCVGTVAGVALECAVLAVAVRRIGGPIAPLWGDWSMPEMRTLRRQYFPLAASVVISSGCVVVDQAVAGRLGPGNVSALAYGTKLAAVLLAVLAAAAGAAVLPAFSRLVAIEDWKRLRHSVLLYCGAALLLMIPVTAALIAGSGWLVRLFFEHGEFQVSAARTVAQIQRLALIQAPFAMLLAIATRLASALSANRLLIWTGVVALTTDVILDLVLSRSMGVAGIALATPVAQALALGVLAVLLIRHSPQLFFAKGQR